MTATVVGGGGGGAGTPYRRGRGAWERFTAHTLA
jgi:hypothetical protein